MVISGPMGQGNPFGAMRRPGPPRRPGTVPPQVIARRMRRPRGKIPPKPRIPAPPGRTTALPPALRFTRIPPQPGRGNLPPQPRPTPTPAPQTSATVAAQRVMRVQTAPPPQPTTQQVLYTQEQPPDVYYQEPQYTEAPPAEMPEPSEAETLTPPEFVSEDETTAEDVQTEDPDATLAPAFEGSIPAKLSTGSKVAVGFTIAALLGGAAWGAYIAFKG